ncbi:uncharacterized protein PgNI_04413 [Pyricularia grisea]|uniref:Uncharacterized protein n=1 Tax=Pyricularia grisea TaxID=148305 RepID=A0A6P8BEK2_PYRGI|nr:uncharacterized protein PgNI_04413 [Pyricularia grisea]TLD14263.1 hypothetical protein PgNI_04413 [Pyricularia grisea]
MAESTDPSMLGLPNTSTEADAIEESVRQLLPTATEAIDHVDPTATQNSEPDESDQQPPSVIPSTSTAHVKQVVVHRPADVDRLDYFAFSHNADAYCHGVEAKWTKGTILTVATKANAASGSDSVQKTPSLEPTPEELHQTPDHHGVYGFLWVGMTPSDETIESLAESPVEDATADANDDQSKDPKKKKPKLQGKKHRRDLTVASSTDEEIRILPKDESALRVVVNLKGKNLSLLKLSNRDNTSGTCISESVKADNVFFFRAFRKDDIKGVGERRTFFKETFNKLRDAMEKDGNDGVAKALKAMARVAAPSGAPKKITATSGGQKQLAKANDSKSTTKNPRAPKSDKADPPQATAAKSGKATQGTKRKQPDIDSSTTQLQANNAASAKSKKQKKLTTSNPASSTATKGKDTAKTKARPPTESEDNASTAVLDHEMDQQLGRQATVTHNNNEVVEQLGIVHNGYPLSALPGTPDSPDSLLGPENSHTAVASRTANDHTHYLSSTSTLRPTAPYPVPTLSEARNKHQIDQMNDEAQLRLLEQNELDQNKIHRGIEARKAQQQHSWQQHSRPSQTRRQLSNHLGQPLSQFFQQPALKQQPRPRQQNYPQANPFYVEPTQPMLQLPHQLGQSNSRYMQNIQSSGVQLPKEYNTAGELFTPLGREVISLVSKMDCHSESNVNVIKYTTTMLGQLSSTSNSPNMIFQLRLSPPAPGLDIKTAIDPLLSEFSSLFPELAHDLNRETFTILLHALRVSDKTVEYNMIHQFIYGFTRELAKQRAGKGDQHALSAENLSLIVQGAINVARDLLYHRNSVHKRGFREEQQRQAVQTMTVDEMADDNSPGLPLGHGEYDDTEGEEGDYEGMDNSASYAHTSFAPIDDGEEFVDDD